MDLILGMVDVVKMFKKEFKCKIGSIMGFLCFMVDVFVEDVNK